MIFKFKIFHKRHNNGFKISFVIALTKTDEIDVDVAMSQFPHFSHLYLYTVL